MRRLLLRWTSLVISSKLNWSKKSQIPWNILGSLEQLCPSQWLVLFVGQSQAGTRIILRLSQLVCCWAHALRKRDDLTYCFNSIQHLPYVIVVMYQKHVFNSAIMPASLSRLAQWKGNFVWLLWSQIPRYAVVWLRAFCFILSNV